MSNMNWVDETEAIQKEERSKGFFNIVEGENKFMLLSHCAPLALVWNNAEKKYETAREGDKNTSVKGVCWVYQDGLIKGAKLPYTVVKSIRALQQNPDWDFTSFPFLHVLTLTAKDAKTKEVDYNLIASPKETEVPAAILEELAKKASPEEMVEKMKAPKSIKAAYPTPGVDGVPSPDDIPF